MSLLPLVVPWLVGVLVLLFHGGRRWVSTVAIGVLAGVVALDLLLLIDMTTGARIPIESVTGGWPQGVGIRLRVDRVSLFFGVISTTVLMAVLLHERGSGGGPRLFPGLVLLLAAGLHGAFFTGDLFNFYVFFELSVVTSFALATYGYGRAEVRGAFSYVVVNLFGSILFLMGVAALYHALGTLDLEQMGARVGTDPPAMILPGVLILVALSLKLGLFPFHGWVPVLYSHARPAVVAALSGALVNLGAYGLLRIGTSALDAARQEGAALLCALGLMAALYGAVLAIRRTRPAELAAYVSVAHAGYLLLALGIGSAHGIAALLLTVLSGSVDKATMFLSLDAAGAVRSWTAMVGAASVAGLPLTLGFLSKVQLFHASMTSPAGWWVTAALLLSALLLIAVSLRFWQLVRVGRPTNHPRRIPAGLLAATIVSLGLLAQPVVRCVWTIGLELGVGR